MPFLTWLASKLSSAVLKDGSDLAKTATEIPKNLVETDKARLEVAELKRKAEDHEHRIVSATFEDVKKYDPKVRYFLEGSRGHSAGLHGSAAYRAGKHEGYRYMRETAPSSSPLVVAFRLIACLGIVALVLLVVIRVAIWVIHRL